MDVVEKRYSDMKSRLQLRVARLRPGRGDNVTSHDTLLCPPYPISRRNIVISALMEAAVSACAPEHGSLIAGPGAADNQIITLERLNCAQISLCW